MGEGQSKPRSKGEQKDVTSVAAGDINPEDFIGLQSRCLPKGLAPDLKEARQQQTMQTPLADAPVAAPAAAPAAVPMSVNGPLGVGAVPFVTGPAQLQRSNSMVRTSGLQRSSSMLYTGNAPVPQSGGSMTIPVGAMVRSSSMIRTSAQQQEALLLQNVGPGAMQRSSSMIRTSAQQQVLLQPGTVQMNFVPTNAPGAFQRSPSMIRTSREQTVLGTQPALPGQSAPSSVPTVVQEMLAPQTTRPLQAPLPFQPQAGSVVMPSGRLQKSASMYKAAQSIQIPMQRSASTLQASTLQASISAVQSGLLKPKTPSTVPPQVMQSASFNFASQGQGRVQTVMHKPHAPNMPRELLRQPAPNMPRDLLRQPAPNLPQEPQRDELLKTQPRSSTICSLDEAIDAQTPQVPLPQQPSLLQPRQALPPQQARVLGTSAPEPQVSLQVGTPRGARPASRILASAPLPSTPQSLSMQAVRGRSPIRPTLAPRSAAWQGLQPLSTQVQQVPGQLQQMRAREVCVPQLTATAAPSAAPAAAPAALAAAPR